MSDAPPISACVITLNEEDHIERCLASVRWADEMLVVDSGSEDRTCERAEKMGARVIHNDWPGFKEQKQLADNRATNDWILSLDADEALDETAQHQIQSLFRERFPEPEVGFEFNRLSYYLGIWHYHGSFYPDRKLRLYNRTETRWGGTDPHAHVLPPAEVRHLKGNILHWPYDDIEDHIEYVNRYTTTMAQKKDREGGTGSVLGAVASAFIKFNRDYFLKRGFLDGSAGFVNAVLGSYYNFLKYAKLWERQNVDSDDVPENPPE